MELKELKAYTIVKEHDIKDLNSQGTILQHKKTGARVVLLANDDENKVFYIGFRTPPVDSTGVPHIIEHTVLCGSRDFPVKDPFIELAKGSLNTFLNAMTFPDKTLYPVASCNDKDFQNLMHVYMDAVFYPNIYKEEKIFKQEGWHYELENAKDDISINGVVYSEMKGAFSSPDDILDREVMNSLFPDNSYGVESGGDPEVIPYLTYEQYLDFHRKYYHPSNSYIYLYGNMDMAEKLIWLDEHYLCNFDKSDISSQIVAQDAFKKPRRIEKDYPITDDEQEKDNTYLSYNVVVDTSLNRELYVAFQVLDYVICSIPGAPLKVALLEKGLGKDIYSVYENGIYQPFFSIVAKNTDADRENEFVGVVETVLSDIVKNGLDKKALLAAINHFEFKYREADFGTYPKGLMYGLQIMDSWLYEDTMPFIHIEANNTYHILKERVSTGYFEELIQKYILDNKHKSVVVVKPKRGLSSERENDLSRRLKEYKDGLSKEQIQNIITETFELKRYQEEEDKKEDLERIPLLGREDLKKEATGIKNHETRVGDTLLLRHDYFTNGIAYLRFSFDCSQVPLETFIYIGLLKAVLGYMNTKNYTYGELYNEINLRTGGMDATCAVLSSIKDFDDIKPSYDIVFKSLYENISDTFLLLEEIITTTCIDDERRLFEIIAELKSRMQSSMISSGHSVATVRAMSYYSESSAISEKVSGLSFYRLLEHLEANFEAEKDNIIASLIKLCHMIFRAENLIISYVSPLKDSPQIDAMITHLKEQLYTDDVEKKKLFVECELKNEGLKTSAQVQYVCRAGNYRKAGLEYTGVLRVLRTIMGYDYMWNRVRVKGGAYGCMSFFGRNGDCYFVSYRDPNLKKTLDVYNDVIQYLENFDVDEREMIQFIIGTVSEVDTPLNPSAKGNRSYMAYRMGLTEEELQKERDELLMTTPENIRQMADYMKAFLSKEFLCVVGNSAVIERNKDLFISTENLFN